MFRGVEAMSGAQFLFGAFDKGKVLSAVVGVAVRRAASSSGVPRTFSPRVAPDEELEGTVVAIMHRNGA